MLFSPGFFLRKSSTTPVTSVIVDGLVTLTSSYTSPPCCRHTWTQLYPTRLLYFTDDSLYPKHEPVTFLYVPPLPPALSKLNHHHVVIPARGRGVVFPPTLLYPPQLSAHLLPGPVNSNPCVSFESTHFSPFHYLVQASCP